MLVFFVDGVLDKPVDLANHNGVLAKKLAGIINAEYFLLILRTTKCICCGGLQARKVRRNRFG